MFWKKKNKTEIKDSEKFKRKTKHAKSIINGKLYNTENSIFVAYIGGVGVLFKTQNGNYFLCNERHSRYGFWDAANNESGTVSETVYQDIKPESVESAKELLGKYNPEKYIEIFGDVEEA